MHKYHRRTHHLLASFLGLIAAATVGCSGDSTGPVIGTLEITVSTTGAKPALQYEIYAVRVDGGATYSVGLNSVLTLSDISVGDHFVSLTGIAYNCTVETPNPSTISVTPGEAVSKVYFRVGCAAPVDWCGWYYYYYCAHAIATTASVGGSSPRNNRSVSEPAWGPR